MYHIFCNRDPSFGGRGNHDLTGRTGMALHGFDVDTRGGCCRGKLHFFLGKQGTVLSEKAVCKGRIPEMQAALCASGMSAASSLSADPLYGVLADLSGEFRISRRFVGSHPKGSPARSDSGFPHLPIRCRAGGKT